MPDEAFRVRQMIMVTFWFMVRAIILLPIIIGLRSVSASIDVIGDPGKYSAWIRTMILVNSGLVDGLLRVRVMLLLRE